MPKSNRYAVYNNKDGKIVYIVDTPHGTPTTQASESVVEVDVQVNTETYSIDTDTGTAVLSEVPVDAVASESMYDNRLKALLDELMRYEMMDALVADRDEYTKYKYDLNYAIKLGSKTLSDLPSRPSWFI